MHEGGHITYKRSTFLQSSPKYLFILYERLKCFGTEIHFLNLIHVFTPFIQECNESHGITCVLIYKKSI